jgi:hypothetical protein
MFSLKKNKTKKMNNLDPHLIVYLLMMIKLILTITNLF